MTRAGASSRRVAVVAVALAFVAAASAGCFALKGDAPIPLDPAANAPQSDFYVDPSGALAGSYLTITDAIAAANASSADAKVIHVSPGNYRAPSETFPLVLRDGVSLEGSTAGETTIFGTGATEVGPPPNFASPVSATIVVGDLVKTSRVAHITFVPTTPTQDGQEAIICDRGNAGTDETPNVLVDHVVIKGFEVGVRALAFAWMGGCHVRVAASIFQDGAYGVCAQGIAQDDGTPISVVSVHLGDGTPTGGNTFRRLRVSPSQDAGLSGGGLRALNGVVGLTAAYNTFRDSDRGIILSQGPSADRTHGIKIENNDFGPLEISGLWLQGNATLVTLTNNHFHDINESPASSVLVGALSGTGLVAELYEGVGGLVARGNTFEACSVGVQILPVKKGSALLEGDIGRIDFGNPSAVGANVFRCNAAVEQETNLASGSTLGGDVFFSWGGESSYSPLFEGNTWDHSPPTTRVAVSSSEAGIDVLVEGVVTLDTGGAKVSTLACPSLHARGP